MKLTVQCTSLRRAHEVRQNGKRAARFTDLQCLHLLLLLKCVPQCVAYQLEAEAGECRELLLIFWLKVQPEQEGSAKAGRLEDKLFNGRAHPKDKTTGDFQLRVSGVVCLCERGPRDSSTFQRNSQRTVLTIFL